MGAGDNVCCRRAVSELRTTMRPFPFRGSSDSGTELLAHMFAIDGFTWAMAVTLAFVLHRDSQTRSYPCTNPAYTLVGSTLKAAIIVRFACIARPGGRPAPSIPSCDR